MSPPVTSLPTLGAPPPPQIDEDRVALSKEALKHAFLDNLFYMQGKFPALATKHDYYMALAYAVRDRMLQRWISTAAAYTKQGSRTVAYLSAEFLIGPAPRQQPPQPRHLRRRARRRWPSSASTSTSCSRRKTSRASATAASAGSPRASSIRSRRSRFPRIGYGIRYEFGIFQQEIVDGWQVEMTDKWLRYGNPWEIARPEWCRRREVRRPHRALVPTSTAACACAGCRDHVVNGVPYDTPILGYRVNTANTLRLWNAEAPESFDFAAFNRGDYYGAVDQKVVSREPHQGALSERRAGRGQGAAARAAVLLRVAARCRTCCASCSVQKIPLERFHEKFAVQLNDTHPAIAVAELMRLLVDEHGMRLGRGVGDHAPDRSATPTTRCCPKRSSAGRCRCSARCCRGTWRSSTRSTRASSTKCACAFFGDEARIARLSLIDESGERYVRMAHLACVGSHAINGVARAALASC